MSSFPEYMNMDISLVIVSMLKQGYIPHKIIKELNQMSKLTILNKDQCQRLLESLTRNDYRGSEINLYRKLFEQLRLLTFNMDDKSTTRSFALLNKYLDMNLFKDAP